MNLDKIRKKCHGYSVIEYVFLNESKGRASYDDDDIRYPNRSFGKVTLYVNCNYNTRAYVMNNQPQFEVIKVEFG